MLEGECAPGVDVVASLSVSSQTTRVSVPQEWTCVAQYRVVLAEEAIWW